MRWTVTTDVSVEPVSADDVKAHLRIAGTAEDTWIASAISAARAEAEQRTGRALAAKTITVTMDAFPTVIVLPRAPVGSVTSISYVDADGDTQTLSTDVYALDGDRVILKPDQAWPQTADQANAVTVVYETGATVHPQVKLWILMMVGTFYENRETTGVQYQAASHPFADRLLDAAFDAQL